MASWFADSVAYNFEVVAAGASGDLAYTVGYEHNEVSVEGQPMTYTLRVTHVYRRENGHWHIVHRHADVPPSSNGTATFPTSRHHRCVDRRDGRGIEAASLRHP
ncbi:MAG TPA: nuclear transport factor 2 family protein [Acidimicrobiales bacterium]|nr:nuclear transport factor 2 family protein [Acidimicrobiales bacterium]